MNKIFKKIIIIVLLLTLFSILVYFKLDEKNRHMAMIKELEFYKEESLREGEIIYVGDSYVYVYDKLKESIMEVDVFPETIHCLIEIGDTAIYVVDMDYTDADLLSIIKKED